MRAIFSSLRRHAPFLFSERGALSLTRSLSRAGTGGGEGLSAGVNRGASGEGLAVQGLDLTHGTVADCALSRADLVEISAANATWTRTHLRRASLRDLDAPASTWTVVDLEGAAVHGAKLSGAAFQLCSFRDATLHTLDLAGSSWVVCDLTRASLTDVDFSDARCTGIDFQDAILQRVSFRGADLRGCLFSGAWCAGADFTGAAVGGADFRGAGGLTAAARAGLAARGARVGGGHLRRLFERVIGGGDPIASQPRVRAAVGLTWALAALALPAVFFARAILHPVNPEAPPGFEEPEPEPVDSAEPAGPAD